VQAQDAATLRDTLTAALKAEAQPLVRRYGPLAVALADPMAAISMLAFDALPRGAADRQALAAWKMSQEHGAVAQVVASQPSGLLAGRHLLLAVSVDAALRDTVLQACETAGITPWRLGVAGLHLFNLARPQFAQRAAALVILAEDYVSLLVADAQARLRHFESRWRQAPGAMGGDEAMQVAGRIALAMRALAAHAEHEAPEGVFVAGAGDAQALVRALAQQGLPQVCELKPEAICEGATGELLLAAAAALDH
jgi:hypothetical protein